MYMSRRRGKGRRARRWYHEQPPNLSSERTTNEKKRRLLLLAFYVGCAGGLEGRERFYEVYDGVALRPDTLYALYKLERKCNSHVSDRSSRDLFSLIVVVIC